MIRVLPLKHDMPMQSINQWYWFLKKTVQRQTPCWLVQQKFWLIMFLKRVGWRGWWGWWNSFMVCIKHRINILKIIKKKPRYLLGTVASRIALYTYFFFFVAFFVAFFVSFFGAAFVAPQLFTPHAILPPPSKPMIWKTGIFVNSYIAIAKPHRWKILIFTGGPLWKICAGEICSLLPGTNTGSILIS